MRAGLDILVLTNDIILLFSRGSGLAVTVKVGELRGGHEGTKQESMDVKLQPGLSPWL